jgi:hypothetical protein
LPVLRSSILLCRIDINMRVMGLPGILAFILCAAPLVAQDPSSHSGTTVWTPDSGIRLQLPPDYTKRTDTTYENVRVDTVLIAGRQVIAQRGLASGGFTGMGRRRRLLLIVPFADGRSAVLHGATGDDAGYDELLAIARTVRESTTP